MVGGTLGSRTLELAVNPQHPASVMAQAREAEVGLQSMVKAKPNDPPPKVGGTLGSRTLELAVNP
jgi:hypothetical protein